jgi:hypothetical protein
MRGELVLLLPVVPLVWLLATGILPWPLTVSVSLAPSTAAPRAPAAQTHTLTVRSRAGASQLAVPEALPPGLWQIEARALTPFGATRGLEQLALGDAIRFDRLVLARDGAVTGLLIGPTPLTLTALGGRFDYEGVLELTVTAVVPPAGS